VQNLHMSRSTNVKAGICHCLQSWCTQDRCCHCGSSAEVHETFAMSIFSFGMVDGSLVLAPSPPFTRFLGWRRGLWRTHNAWFGHSTLGGSTCYFIEIPPFMGLLVSNWAGELLKFDLADVVNHLEGTQPSSDRAGGSSTVIGGCCSKPQKRFRLSLFLLVLVAYSIGPLFFCSSARFSRLHACLLHSLVHSRKKPHLFLPGSFGVLDICFRLKCGVVLGLFPPPVRALTACVRDQFWLCSCFVLVLVVLFCARQRGASGGGRTG
jgi:hypothetical protein